MNLPFRYQFLLAPFTVVALLAGLVAYTLFEFSSVNRNNDILRHWEILNDRVQSAMASADNLKLVIAELSASADIRQNQQFFSYLEQTSLLADNLRDPILLEQATTDLLNLVKSNESFLREPEKSDLSKASIFVAALQPVLEYQYKIFTAQRRTAFIDNHHALVNISSRMTTVLLTGLTLCIILASALTFWGLAVTRQRLQHLTQRAHSIGVGDPQPLTIPTVTPDELDELEMFLTNMTTRLRNVISVENILRGAEDERRRIAMDMHDGVLADLTAINRKLDGIVSQSASTHKINSLRSDVDDVINLIRNTIDDIHPQVLETLGLEAALQSFLDRHSAVSGFPVYHFNCDLSIDDHIQMDHKINLFRIITEVINNVIKHAHCDRLEINLRRAADNLVVTIEDNGVGMPKNQSVTGHGLANISERTRLIGAAINWRASRFSQGVCFELVLPLHKVVNKL